MSTSIASSRMWPDNGGIYRGVHSLNTAWEASPVIPDAHDRLDGYPWNPEWVHQESEQERDVRLGKRPRKAACGSFWRGLRRLISTLYDHCHRQWHPLIPVLTAVESDHDENNNTADAGLGSPPVVAVHLWKAYGYWARPIVNRVQVNNIGGSIGHSDFNGEYSL